MAGVLQLINASLYMHDHFETRSWLSSEILQQKPLVDYAIINPAC